MTKQEISSKNVGRIAERIVSNELEARGFRVSDLNKEGLSANADILAARAGKTWQIQVKGATYDGWWVNYCFCDQKMMERRKTVFNSASSFYHADLVILVCVKTTVDYKCVIMPTVVAEEAAQLCMDYSFRTKKANGDSRKPGRLWVWLEKVRNMRNASIRHLIESEHELVKTYIDKWDFE